MEQKMNMMEHANMKLNGEAPTKKKCRCVPWRKRTLLERYLIVICIAMFVAFFTMIGVVLYLEHVYKLPSSPVCSSAICRAKAGRVMSYMDFDTKPCDDFYDFACGSFSNIHKLPSHLNRFGPFNMAANNMQRISREIIEADEESEEPDFVKIAKSYYKTCLDLNEDATNIIKEVLNITELYQWPILEHDDILYKNELLERSMAITIIFNGVNPYFHTYAGSNTTVGELYISKGSVFVEEEILLNDTDENCIRNKEKYQNLLIYTLFKADTVMEAIEYEADEIIRFETLFANITGYKEEDNSSKTTLNEMADECDEIGWKDIIKYIYKYFEHEEDYYDEIPVRLYTKEYMEELCNLFRKSKIRTIYNYLVWRFLASHLSQFDPYFDRLQNDIMGNKEYLPTTKSEKCLDSFREGRYQLALNYLVINHLQPDKIVEEVKEYGREVREEMDHMFSVESWLDPVSRNISKKILWDIAAEIGYSSASLDTGMLEEYFSNVNLTKSHIENILVENRNRKRSRMFNESSPLLSEINITQPLDVSGYFTGKSYVLTLGALQPPFFTYGVPKYINYPVAGFVIAHELSHAFDSLDLDNRDNSTDQWPDDIVEKFKEKRSCYVEQYSQYPLDGKDNNKTVNGNHTIGDNIADNSGLVQSYMAYEKNVRAKQEEPRLPGLDFTNQQMFFISYSQMWCEILGDVDKVFKYDSHSPGRYRVIGPLQNFPEFSKAFNCPVDSPMNPKDKCRMWG